MWDIRKQELTVILFAWHCCLTIRCDWMYTLGLSAFDVTIKLISCVTLNKLPIDTGEVPWMPLCPLTWTAVWLTHLQMERTVLKPVRAPQLLHRCTHTNTHAHCRKKGVLISNQDRSWHICASFQLIMSVQVLVAPESPGVTVVQLTDDQVTQAQGVIQPPQTSVIQAPQVQTAQVRTCSGVK